MRDALCINSQTATDLAYTRLHISPLDAELLEIVLPSSFPRPRNVSFHTLEALPGKRYGFVELPTADAERLRKKLNGAVLKGCKIRVEVARPSSMARPAGEAAMAVKNDDESGVNDKKYKNKSKKRKRDGEEIAGVELSGRKVKRGWTVAEEPKLRRDKRRDKDEKNNRKEKRKKEAKSKYTDGPECLVKAVLPPGIPDSAGDGEGGRTRKRKKGGVREVVFHEFENTTKFPSFLRNPASESKAGKATEFVDGKGWVDEYGNLVERARSKRGSGGRTEPVGRLNHERAGDESPSSNTSSPAEGGNVGEGSGNKSSNNEELEEDNAFAVPPRPAPSAGPTITPISILKSSPARPKSSGSTKSLTIKIPPPATPSASSAAKAQVHPLEALYKRPRLPDGTPADKDSSGAAKPFSFFDSDDIELDGGDGGSSESASGNGSAWRSGEVPMTPFTRLDFETRGVRSAAPTPDTAHVGRRFSFWGRNDEAGHEVRDANGLNGAADDEDEEDGEDGQPTAPQLADTASTGGERGAEKAAASSSSSDFQKWFWEHRGELNRSWKRRRKVAAKEKRYRDNRARAERAV